MDLLSGGNNLQILGGIDREHVWNVLALRLVQNLSKLCGLPIQVKCIHGKIQRGRWEHSSTARIGERILQLVAIALVGGTLHI